MGSVRHNLTLNLEALCPYSCSPEIILQEPLSPKSGPVSGWFHNCRGHSKSPPQTYDSSLSLQNSANICSVSNCLLQHHNSYSVFHLVPSSMVSDIRSKHLHRISWNIPFFPLPPRDWCVYSCGSLSQDPRPFSCLLAWGEQAIIIHKHD